MYKILFSNMRIPVIASPMFIVSNPNMVIEQCKSGIIGSNPNMVIEQCKSGIIGSNPNMVIEQCKSGIIGSFPALNARTSTKKSDLDIWLHKIKNS